MGFFATGKDRKAISKTLSGLAVNLSAAWYAAIFIVPNFAIFPSIPTVVLILTMDLLFGTLFLLIAFKFERKLL